MSTNRIILKANRNLYQDQLLFISVRAREQGLSESEFLRIIIDTFIATEEQSIPKALTQHLLDSIVAQAS